MENNPKDLHELASEIELEMVEKFNKNREQEIQRACSRIVLFLKKYRLEVNNFDYLRIRNIANTIIDEYIESCKEKSKKFLKKEIEVKYGGGTSLFEETLYRYFFEEFGAYPDQIFGDDGVENTPALTEYLKKLREERKSV